MRTLGIDLSADPRKTAACTIDWDTHEVRLLSRPASDEVLVEALGKVDVSGIDVPLGWPDDFIDALLSHRDRVGWPPAPHQPPGDREALRFRTTDLFVRQAGALPLSVSTDRIGVAAMRGARIQHLATTSGIVIDRSGLTGRAIEAYPAAALRAWGLASSGYKRPPNAEVLKDLVGAFARRCGPLTRAVEGVLNGCDDDDFDALVCAVVARASLRGMTTPPDSTQLASAQREGWIHVPTASIEEIIG
jgi:predicted nuclease with RNAse H fold